MTENEKQLTEQIAGAMIAAADMNCHLVLRLVDLQKLSAAEAATILSDQQQHLDDLAKRNSHLPGSVATYSASANRVQQHLDQLRSDAGLSEE